MADPNDFAHHPRPNVPWERYEEALAAASRATADLDVPNQRLAELSQENEALKRQLKHEQDPRYRDPERRRHLSDSELKEIALRALGESPSFQDEWLEALQPFLRSVSKLIAREVLELFRDDGFCNYDFHAPLAEFDSSAADAVCRYCEKTRAEHHVLACSEPDEDAEDEDAEDEDAERDMW